MLPQEFMDKDELPSLAQVLLHFYEQHHQKIPDRKTCFEKILNGIDRRIPGSWDQNIWNGNVAMFRLGSGLDFSKDPEGRWKRFEEELYKLDCNWERTRKVKEVMMMS
jgi:hypothetical protein